MALELIDAGVALDLLAESVRRHGGRTTGSVDGGIVAVALSIGGLAPQDVAPFRDREVRTLWARGELPCPMTLGGVLVLGRAQRAQRAGASGGVAAAHAARRRQLGRRGGARGARSAGRRRLGAHHALRVIEPDRRRASFDELRASLTE